LVLGDRMLWLEEVCGCWYLGYFWMPKIEDRRLLEKEEDLEAERGEDLIKSWLLLPPIVETFVVIVIYYYC